MPLVPLYARYSSDLQSRRSVDDQFLVCRRFAEPQAWELPAAVVVKRLPY